MKPIFPRYHRFRLLTASLLILAAAELPAADLSDLTWTTNAGAVTITDCDTDAAGSLDIPATIGGDPVRTIGANAFRSCTSLVSVIIPDSVTSISDYAFIHCTSLGQVTLGNGVESIGFRSFHRCGVLPEITIPASVTSIQRQAFTHCDSFVMFAVDPTSVTFTSQGGVLFTSGLQQLVAYPNGLTGSYAIPAGVVRIRQNAFSATDGLTSVNIPAGVSTIDAGAFSGCPGLTTLTVDPANADYQSVGGVIFDDSGSLLHTCPGGLAGSYSIPTGVTIIGNQAFSECTGLTQLTMPSTLAMIQANAFESCVSLQSASIPNSVTSIGTQAFYECQSLVSVNLPAGITSLPNYVFYGCLLLPRITIPAGVTAIGYACFFGVDSLARVIFEGSAPTDASDAFDDLPPGAVAIVSPSVAASFGGIGAIWNGMLVTELREMRIVNAGFLPSGAWFIDVVGGTAGLKVTSSANLQAPFADQAGVIETNDDSGHPNRFVIQSAGLPAGSGFFRVELD